MMTFPSLLARTGRPLTCAAALLGLVSGLPLRAAPPPAATASPAADAPLDALDGAALRAHVTEQVKVRGTPTGTGHSKAGNVGYMNFAPAHQAVSLVFFFKPGQAGGAPASEDDLKPFVGKPIIVTGRLSEYKGDLRVVVDSLDQIKTAP